MLYGCLLLLRLIIGSDKNTDTFYWTADEFDVKIDLFCLKRQKGSNMPKCYAKILVGEMQREFLISYSLWKEISQSL